MKAKADVEADEAFVAGTTSATDVSINMGDFAYGPEDMDELFKKFAEEELSGFQLLQESYDGAAKLLSGLSSHPKDGIQDETVEKRRQAFGENSIPQKRATTYLELLWEALQDLTMIMLCISAIVQLIMGFSIKVCGHGIEKSWMEPFAIMVSVLVVINVTAISDWSQEQDLRKQNSLNDEGRIARVIRDGATIQTHPSNIVVGDVLYVEVGDVVAADGICISGSNLKMDEASLTGEADKMAKVPAEQCEEDKINHVNPFVFGGCKVVEGKGKIIVVRVGRKTTVGAIQWKVLYGESDDAEGAHEESESSELTKKLDMMVRKISSVGVIIAVSTAVIMLVTWSVLHFEYGMVADETTNTPAFWADKDDSKTSWDDDTDPDFLVDVFVTAITILVVAIPEGLPLAVTLALSYSVKQMVHEQLTVKKIDSAETMGSATTICTDKTGTLTKNIMVVVAFVGGGKDQFVLRPEKLDAPTPAARQQIMKGVMEQDGYSPEFQTLLADSICVNSSNKAVVEDTGEMNYKYQGNPTDCAMLAMCYEMGYMYEDVRSKPSFQAEDESLKIGRNNTEVVPFASEIKCMMWAVPINDGKGVRVFVKGAGEKVLGNCTSYLDSDGVTVKPLDDDAQNNLNSMVTKFQNSAYRVITTGYKDLEGIDALQNFQLREGDFQLTDLNKDFTLIGIIGIQDPLKDTVKAAIASCFNAGVDVRMITGDNKRTAVAIAINAGILREEHFNHVKQKHPSYADKELRREHDKYFNLLLNHKDMDEIRASMQRDKRKKAEIDAFIDGCETCRGVMVDKGLGAEPVFDADPLAALRENFALEGTEFARKVHSRNWDVAHYSFKGDATNESYGVPVVGVDANGEYDPDEECYTDVKETKLPKGVNQEALDEIWPRLRVMARCHPMDKQTLVSGLMESEICFNRSTRSKLLNEENIWIFGDNQVVAVTGDGTNDAPALKKANVGFAMGIAGTEVAKEACDIIVMDDNFSSVVTSLKWGRNVYDSVAKFLQFQLTVNVVAVIVASLGAVIYQSSPLGAVQMLWVNLVMDSLGSLALATEKPHDSLLERKPYGRQMSMINRPMKFNIIGQSIYQLFIVLFIMFYGEIFLYDGDDRSKQQNALDGSAELVSGRAAGCDPTQHYSVLFNAFVMMTLFNQIAARKLNNEFNLFAGVTENNAFILIMCIEFVAQACFVQFLGNFAECYDEGLTWRQWIWCMGFGIGVWPMQMLINVAVRVTAGDKADEEDKAMYEDIRTSAKHLEDPGPTSLLERAADAVSHSRLRVQTKSKQSTSDLTKQGHERSQNNILMQSQNQLKTRQSQQALQSQH